LVVVNRTVMAQCFLTACDTTGRKREQIRVNPDSCCSFFGVVSQSHVDKYALPRAKLPDSALLTSGGATGQKHWYEFYFEDRGQCYSVPLIACPDEFMPPNSTAILENWLTVILLGWDLTQICMAAISHHMMAPAYQGDTPRFIRRKEDGVWAAIPNGPLPEGPLLMLPLPPNSTSQNPSQTAIRRNPKVDRCHAGNNYNGANLQNASPALGKGPNTSRKVTFATQNRFGVLSSDAHSHSLTDMAQAAPPTHRRSRKQQKKDGKSMPIVQHNVPELPAHRGPLLDSVREPTTPSSSADITSSVLPQQASGNLRRHARKNSTATTNRWQGAQQRFQATPQPGYHGRGHNKAPGQVHQNTFLSPPKTSMAGDQEMSMPTLRPPKSIGNRSGNAAEPPRRLHFEQDAFNFGIEPVQSSKTQADFPSSVSPNQVDGNLSRHVAKNTTNAPNRRQGVQERRRSTPLANIHRQGQGKHSQLLPRTAFLPPTNPSMAGDQEMSMPTLRPPKSIGNRSSNAPEPPQRLRYEREACDFKIESVESPQTQGKIPPTKTKVAGLSGLTPTTSQPSNSITSPSNDASEPPKRFRTTPEPSDSKIGSLQTQKSHGRKSRNRKSKFHNSNSSSSQDAKKQRGQEAKSTFLTLDQRAAHAEIARNAHTIDSTMAADSAMGLDEDAGPAANYASTPNAWDRVYTQFLKHGGSQQRINRPFYASALSSSSAPSSSC